MKLSIPIFFCVAVSCANPNIDIEVSPTFSSTTSSASAASAENKQLIDQLSKQLAELSDRPLTSPEDSNRQKARIAELEKRLASLNEGNEGLSKGSKTFTVNSGANILSSLAGQAGYFVTDNLEINAGLVMQSEEVSFDDSYSSSYGEYANVYAVFGANYFLSDGSIKPYVGASYGVAIEAWSSGDIVGNRYDTVNIGVLQIGALVSITKNAFLNIGVRIPVIDQISSFGEFREEQGTAPYAGFTLSF
jgi:outer membrane protein W